MNICTVVRQNMGQNFAYEPAQSFKEITFTVIIQVYLFKMRGVSLRQYQQVDIKIML